MIDLTGLLGFLAFAAIFVVAFVLFFWAVLCLFTGAMHLYMICGGGKTDA